MTTRVVRCLATGNTVDVPDGHWALTSPEFVEVTAETPSPPEPKPDPKPAEPTKRKK